jgi:hypothetical protein
MPAALPEPITLVGGSMLLRIVLVGALLVGAMVAVKDGRVLRDAGLTGSCSSVSTPTGQNTFWKACKKGRLDGRPDLSRQGCTAVSIKSGVEWWRCPASIGSSRAAA